MKVFKLLGVLALLATAVAAIQVGIPATVIALFFASLAVTAIGITMIKKGLKMRRGNLILGGTIRMEKNSLSHGKTMRHLNHNQTLESQLDIEQDAGDVYRSPVNSSNTNQNGIEVQQQTAIQFQA